MAADWASRRAEIALERKTREDRDHSAESVRAAAEEMLLTLREVLARNPETLPGIYSIKRAIEKAEKAGIK